jgi:gluconokinase
MSSPISPEHSAERKHAAQPPRVLVIMGVAGSGKTTTGTRLSKLLGWTFRDADSFHPPGNIEKMSLAVPLTDEDRWPWLEAIAGWIDECRRKGEPGIVSCSALKRVYREVLMAHRPDVRLIFLRGRRELIADRMSRRKNHFMPTALLDSQFATLEEPHVDERPFVVNIAIPPNRVVEVIIDGLKLSPVRPLRPGHRRL